MGPTAKVVGSRLVASGGVASSGHPVDGSASAVAVAASAVPFCLQGSSHSLRLGLGHVAKRCEVGRKKSNDFQAICFV